MKAVEHDPLVAASALRSKEKILFIASTESTERYTATSSITKLGFTTRSKTKSKKKAVIKKEKDYLVALSAARSEKMLRDRRNRSKLMSTKKRDARNNCLVALSEMSPTEHLPVYRFSRSKKNVTSSTSPLSNVIINDMPPTTAVPSPRPAMQPSMAMADAHASAVPPQQPPTAPISSIPPTTEPTSSIPTTTSAPVSFVPPETTSTDQPKKNKQPSKTAEELKADINDHLNKRPPVFVLGGDYVRRQTEAGACCVFLHSENGTRIEGDIKMTNGPLLILRHIDDMSAAGYECQYRFIHDNENQSDNYVLFAFVGKMNKSNDILDLPNDVADIYTVHKKNIMSASSSHYESYGTYFADGLKASYTSRYPSMVEKS